MQFSLICNVLVQQCLTEVIKNNPCADMGLDRSQRSPCLEVASTLELYIHGVKALDMKPLSPE